MKRAIALVALLAGCADCPAGTMNCSPARQAGVSAGLLLVAPVLLADGVGSAVRDAAAGPPPAPLPPLTTSLPLTGEPTRQSGGSGVGVLARPLTRDGWVCGTGRVWFEPGTDRILGCTLGADPAVGPHRVPAGNAYVCSGGPRCAIFVETPRGVVIAGRTHNSGQIIRVDADGGNPQATFGPP
jgi:hypothetical protein